MTEIVEKYIKKAPSVGEKGDLPICRFVDLPIWRFVDLPIWRFVDLPIWRFVDEMIKKRIKTLF